MNRAEFHVLHYLLINGGARQRQIADACSMSVGAANSALKALRSQGLVTEGNIVTEQGVAALQPYKVQNAIIMAAGMSSRFVPISYEHPKGTFKVRGEILIERQIRQLQESGITDITVVVGYKKEEFFYLEDKFGVKIVVNPDFASRNNNSTLYKVRASLGNTYICCSDTYFSTNPFEMYAYRSYYSASYHNGPTTEYCVTTKGKDHRIVGVTAGGVDAWVMLDHAYWDRDFSAKFVDILEREYDKPETAGKLWEDIFAEHADELPLYMRKCPTDAIWEFDSLDDLRGFDPNFIENVDSAILDNICSVIGCEREDVKHFTPINQGLTNLSVRFDVGDASYVYRHPGAGTGEIIVRESEAYSQDVARELGIDRTFLYEDPAVGWKISRFIEGCVPFDYHNPEHVRAAMQIGRTLHGSGKTSPWKFDVHAKAAEIVELLGKVEFIGFSELMELARRLDAYVKADAVAPVLCHNDFCAPNFLVHDDGIDLVDWEYSAMSDYASDLGTFVCCSDFGIAEARDVLHAYFNREPSAKELRHCMAYVGLCAYYWFVWALYKEKSNDRADEWLYPWYRMAGLFGRYAEQLYLEA